MAGASTGILRGPVMTRETDQSDTRSKELQRQTVMPSATEA